jgi:hypothetical protein
VASNDVRWQIRGDYFENCSCDVICPCLFSPGEPLTAEPTGGACELPLAIHTDQGKYGDVTLDGLNAVEVWRSPGPMADGNISVAIYLDERADEPQRFALQAIFTGAAGGPIGAFEPLFSEILGVKFVPIAHRIENHRRSAYIPDVLDLRVRGMLLLGSEDEIWLPSDHPLSPDKVALAIGEAGSTYSDHGMRWDNSGKSGHYFKINWSNG